MKTLVWGWVVIVAVAPVTAPATTYFVDGSNGSPAPPYTNWAGAAVNIQDAIGEAVDGDTVLVTNGVYAGGGEVSADGLSNRVALTSAITVQSVNGPWVTTIQGAGATNGPSAIRCAWLTNYAVLCGFTLSWGATSTRGGQFTAQSGGGVWCASSNAVVDNCVIVSNTASGSGAAAYQGTLNNCLVRSNNQTLPLNILCNATLNSCTVISNTSGAAVYQCSMTNCIVYYNLHGNYSANYQGVSAAAYCCTTPALGGPGNFTNAPELQLDGAHLAGGSPCIGAGTNLVIGTDIFGMAWGNPPSVGCAEFSSAPTVGEPQITLIGEPAGFRIGNATAGGLPPYTFQWLENGVPLQDNGHFSSTRASNLVAMGVSLADAGGYQLVVSNASGVATSAVAQLIIHTADAAGTNPAAPYSTWATAATSIQDAIDSAAAGEIVLVTNGVYATGAKSMDGVSTNRATLDKALLVVSANGYANTVIEGAWDPVSTNGPGAVRCAWLTNGAILSGFALQHGATPSGIFFEALQGGGAWCSSSNALVSSCLLSNNSAFYGGGINSGTLDNSLVVSNFAVNYGGGCYYSTLNNCLVISNQAGSGAGAFDATLNNCTVEYNVATLPSDGAGVWTETDLAGNFGFVRNSIVANNYDHPFGPETILDNYNTATTFSYSCAVNSFQQAPTGAGNISGDPQFLDLYHISVNSPCRGGGSALYASATDFDGEPWNDPPSMGCSEVVVSNLVGPLSVGINSYGTSSVLVSTPSSPARYLDFVGAITGRASSLAWNFGDGPAITNADYYVDHFWTNAGDYNVVFTAYNNDNPAGVSANLTIHVLPLTPPQLQSVSLLSNNLQFQFTGQVSANYLVQYATNLAPPVTWSTLDTFFFSSGNAYQITDVIQTNEARFYRVKAQ